MDNAITPRQRSCFAAAVKFTEGNVKNPGHITNCENDYTELIWDVGKEKPYLCIDLGPASPGGYPVFEIAGFEGDPILRVSYSDWYDYICDPNYRERGDFKRGSCKYLGPELPVMPGNPNRFELYHICRNGTYTYPLIQGQQRFALLTLEAPGCSVKISSFYIYYTSSLQSYPGRFYSSDKRLDHLWDASIYTVQLATLSNSASLDIADHRLMVRALTKGNRASVLKSGGDWSDYTLHLECELPIEPDCENAVFWSVRTVDDNNAYVFRLTPNGRLRYYLRKDGVNYEKPLLQEAVASVTYNKPFCIDTVVCGDHISVSVDGTLLSTVSAGELSHGSIGFCPTIETWFLVYGFTVTAANGNILYEEYFKKGLSDYHYCAAEEFIADGAKRDRLPWVGDLFWAFENVYYSFGNFEPADNTIEMFRRHQCPDGYVWGTCYPENRTAPREFDYGLYQSDIFSAWYVITISRNYLFTANRKNLEKWYDSVKRDLNYLSMQVESTGLFYQRYETSKGLWDHVLNDYGYYSYNNLIIQQAFREGAFIANALGDDRNAGSYLAIADKMLRAISDAFFQEETGMYAESLNSRKLSYSSTAFALAFGLVPEEYAAETVKSMCREQEKSFQNGKLAILFIHGCFRYGFSEEAYRTLTGSTGKIDFLGECTLNWIDAVQDEKGPACTAESMPYGHNRVANGECWGDSSHPDTAVAFLLSGDILGVRPTSAGFKTFRFQPLPCALSSAGGSVPTPYGTIDASFALADNGILTVTLCHPRELTGDIIIEEKYRSSAIINKTAK